MRIRVSSRMLVFLCLLQAGCGGSAGSQGGEGPGGREQSLALKGKEELELGRRAYAEALKPYRGKVLPADAAPVRRARAVLERLVGAAEIEILQREMNLRTRGYRFEWELAVVRDRQVNAFCVPGGKMAVFTGMLDMTGDDDDFLATVLSHEMAHALAHHASERLARERSGDGFLGGLSYGRMQEEEADHMGVFLMAFAGFDARKAPAFWARMRQAHGGGGGGLAEIFSSHPSNESRVRALASQAPRATAAKKRFDQLKAARSGR